MGQFILHASCIAYAGRAVLILGKSGQGKSGLAMHLMAFGAALVSDDRTEVFSKGAELFARAPTPLAGLIEARGVGVLNAHPLEEAEVHLAVDLDHEETDRMPPARAVSFLGVSLPCLHKVDSPYFPAAVLQYLKAGRRDP